MWQQLGIILAALLISHFIVMWAWTRKYKATLGAAISSLEVQSYKTVNEVRAGAGLELLPPEMGGNMVLNRVLVDVMLKRNLI